MTPSGDPVYYIDDDSDEEAQQMLSSSLAGKLAQPVLKFGNVPSIFSSLQKQSKLNNKTGDDASSSKKSNAKVKVSVSKEGQVLQCIELPNQISNDFCTQSVTPVCDGMFVLVVVTPRCLNTRLNVLANGLSDIIDSSSVVTCDEASASCIAGGFYLLYRVVNNAGVTMLDPSPVLVSDRLPNLSCAPLKVSYLPGDMVAHDTDEDSTLCGSDSAGSSVRQPDGNVIVTTVAGDVQVISLSDFSTKLTIPAPADDQYIDATFCSGKNF